MIGLQVKTSHIVGLQNGEVHLQRAERALVRVTGRLPSALFGASGGTGGTTLASGGSGTDTIAKATPGRCVPLCTPAAGFLCVVLVMLHYSHSVIGGIKFSIALRSFGWQMTK